MRVTTWNVNSIRRRLDAVLVWLERNRPNVVCLQETRCLEDDFPAAAFAAAGYRAVVAGQPARNGVAVLADAPMDDVMVHPFWERDPDARSIAVTVAGARIVNVYVPYGEALGTRRFRHKIRWLGRLRTFMAARSPHVVAGDFNIAPDDRDVYDPKRRRGTLICSPAERRAFESLLGTGYDDALRRVSDAGGRYTWWSHRRGAVAGNRGLRVDHHLVHRSLASRIRSVEIDIEERGRRGASDHAPVTLTLYSAAPTATVALTARRNPRRFRMSSRIM